MKVINYGIVSATDSKALVTAVMAWIDQGWQPLGSVVVAGLGTNSGLVQTMVVYEQKDPQQANSYYEGKDHE